MLVSNAGVRSGRQRTCGGPSERQMLPPSIVSHIATPGRPRPTVPVTDAPPTVFVTGATGYIGGRLAPRLLERGYPVRCLARYARKLRARPWADHEQLDVIAGDIADEDALANAMTGCHAAYYLVHSMNAASANYREQDRRLAETFARAARRAGVQRILYLGGLGETGDGLSEHLTSRREVETALGSSGVPVTVMRAAMIIGSGSASFEILRYLVERLPIMITPRWVSTECQPIAVRDVLHYLIAALETPETVGATLDIGGPDVWSYAKIMREMADALDLRKRLVIPVPVLTPRLSSLWIHLVTPLDASIARPLAEGLRNRVVCRDDVALRLMPHPCFTIRQAIDAALTKTRTDSIETAWSDAGVMRGDPSWAGGTEFTDRRETTIDAPLADVWATVSSLGGQRGYFESDWLWRLRGIMDRFVGGPGLRRSRRSAGRLMLGDALDFWRVTAINAPEQLELTAEIKLPGVATLRFDLDEASPEPPTTRLTMTATFRPRGLLGIAYRYAVVPLHGVVFQGMLRGFAKEAEERAQGISEAHQSHESTRPLPTSNRPKQERRPLSRCPRASPPAPAASSQRVAARPRCRRRTAPPPASPRSASPRGSPNSPESRAARVLWRARG